MTNLSKPLPETTGPEQKYFNLLKSGKWMVPRCSDCNRYCFYPRLLCPACGSQRFDWVEPSGLGRIYSTTVMRKPPEAGGDTNLVLVDLDEGIRLMSRVVGVEPGQVRIGARVRAFIPQDADGGKVVFNIVE